MNLAGNLAAVRTEIAEACKRSKRSPEEVRVIAVTKSQGPEVLPELMRLGVRDFGENRVDHLELMHAAVPEGRFHAIGRVQSRQFPTVVAHSVCLHSLASRDHVAKLDQACAKVGRKLEVFVQVNVSGEASKAGVTPNELGDMVAAVRAAGHLAAIGLMTMAPEMEGAVDADLVRRCFRDLRKLSEQHGLARLSMGMSEDFALAIEEGATDIRVGRRLFI